MIIFLFFFLKKKILKMKIIFIFLFLNFILKVYSSAPNLDILLISSLILVAADKSCIDRDKCKPATETCN